MLSIIFKVFIYSTLSPEFLRISTTSKAIAGAEESPGDFIPATSINPFTSSASSTIKSPQSGFALSPAKFLMTLSIINFICSPYSGISDKL